jgi:hypothetical protein
MSTTERRRIAADLTRTRQSGDAAATGDRRVGDISPPLRVLPELDDCLRQFCVGSHPRSMIVLSLRAD